uniref:Uncharacterized protein n=1 Tax=Solanum demissum TaxID=50514 RepID=Q0KIJ9_SOLDE|nr:hypothetical protein SDM1_56t00012 [Solanum demissum]
MAAYTRFLKHVDLVTCISQGNKQARLSWRRTVDKAKVCAMAPRLDSKVASEDQGLEGKATWCGLDKMKAKQCHVGMALNTSSVSRITTFKEHSHHDHLILPYDLLKHLILYIHE